MANNVKLSKGEGEVGWLFLWPDIARSRPEFSHQMWGCVLLANFSMVSLEFVLLKGMMHAPT